MNIPLMEHKVATPMAHFLSIVLGAISQNPVLLLLGGIVSVLAGINYCFDIANKWEARKLLRQKKNENTTP